MNAIEIRDLTKYYGKTRGIEQISLTVRRGAFYGFIGPNGAGKSTTLRTLLGLIRPSSGSARIYGLDIGKEREKILARVGYLPSEVSFYPGTRVKDVLKLSADLHRRDCRKTGRLLCERLQLDESRKVDELSFGNRKKTAIVCALQHEPELLILDEPTGGLDPLMQREFFEILRERNKAGATVFLSSHILEEIQHNCTDAAMIKAGAILTEGSVAKLLGTGTKRVSIRGSAHCGSLAGVKDFHLTREGADFLYSGDMNALMRTVSEGDIQDITVTEPDLEEIFLHYYERGGEEYDHPKA